MYTHLYVYVCIYIYIYIYESAADRGERRDQRLAARAEGVHQASGVETTKYIQRQTTRTYN